MKRSITILIALLLLNTACMNKFSGSKSTAVQFIIEEDLRSFEESDTKGYQSDILCKDENGISSIQLILYEMNSGEYCQSKVFSDINECFMDVKDNTVYYVYALVNMDEVIPPRNVSEIPDLVYTLPSMDRVTNSSGFLPMAGKGVFDSGAARDVNIFVSRLVSEISISYESDEGITLVPSMILVADAPLEVYPFGKEGSKPDKTGNGDYATFPDIKDFASGLPVRMFMLENMNHPSYTPPETNDATEPEKGISWIEIQGRIKNTLGIATADIKYRFALDFKIERNKRYHISFKITPSGVIEDSWRVTMTDAKLDMGVDTLITSVGNMTFINPPASKYTDLTYSIGNSSIATLTKNGGIMGRKKGMTHIRAYSREFNAAGSVPLVVLDADEDVIDIHDIPVLLGGTDTLNFYASMGQQINVNTASGPQIIDITPEAGGSIRVTEDQYVRLAFDPDMASKGRHCLAITIKEAIPFSSNTYACMIFNKSGNFKNFKIRTIIPELEVLHDKTVICETGECINYKIQLKHKDRVLSPQEFEPELYEKIYGDICPNLKILDKRHIDISEPDKIYAFAADGTEIYSTTVMFRGSSFYKDFKSGNVSLRIAVTPAFRDNGGKMDALANTSLRTESGTSKITFPIDSYNVTGASIELRKLGWDRSWESGKTSETGLVPSPSLTSGLVYKADNNACGPYAIRLEKLNTRTGKIFSVIYYFDIYLEVEAGIHFPWRESMLYNLDLQAILNYNTEGGQGCRALEYLDGMPIISVNKEFGSSSKAKLCDGQTIKSWNTCKDFFFDDTAHALLPFCENFMDSIIYNFGSFGCRLFNPFDNAIVAGTSFMTDDKISKTYFDGDNILIKVILHNGPLYTITHTGCANHANGETETNRY